MQVFDLGVGIVCLFRPWMTEETLHSHNLYQRNGTSSSWKGSPTCCLGGRHSKWQSKMSGVGGIPSRRLRIISFFSQTKGNYGSYSCSLVVFQSCHFLWLPATQFAGLLPFFDLLGVLYIDDLENMLDEEMVSLFNAEFDDGSFEEVMRYLIWCFILFDIFA